jgi:hypothetical protein
LKLAGVAIGCFAFLAAAPGVAFAQSKCTGGELKAAGKKAGGKAKCWSKADGKGVAVDGTCLSGAEGKFSASYAKAVTKGGCVNTTDAGTIETKVDAFITDLVTEINGGTGAPAANKCSSKEIGAAGKKAGGLLKCYAKAAAKNIPLDSACTGKAVTKFGASWTKAAALAPCLTTIDATTIENKVDAFAADVNSELTAGGGGGGCTGTNTGPCACGSPTPTSLNFTTGIGAGNCGTLKNSTGGLIQNLACGGLYTGGGTNSVPLPFQVPDMGSSLTGVSACAGTSLTLTNLTSTQTTSNRNCTSVGCLFGPPLPIPNSASTPTSVCVINTVAADASGTADCSSGASALNLPLTSELFLDGDLFPAAPGIQVCPVCNKTCNAGSNLNGPCNVDADCPGAGGGSCAGSNKCHGGPNDGLGCTPADSVVGTLSVFPTSHDCPPPPLMDIGGLPIAFALTTGTTTVTAHPLSGMPRVFCGFCRDVNAAGTNCFEGDPDTSPPIAGCPKNSLCTGNMLPFNCCTGSGTGSCNQAPKSCTSASQCTDGNGTWPDCQQKDPGAFSSSTANTITETGAPSGDLTDGLGHASTLVSIFCVPPTFNKTVDNAGDLPGPGAVSLPGTAQVLP